MRDAASPESCSSSSVCSSLSAVIESMAENGTSPCSPRLMHAERIMK
jgi:hypothetical protein